MIKEKLIRIRELRSEGMTWIQIIGMTLEFIGIRVPNRSIINNFREIFYIEKCRTLNRLCSFLKKDNKSMVIIETGVLGDCMLVVDAFKRISEHCQENGCELIVVCNRGMKKIFYEYGELTNIKYICFNDREKITFNEFKDISKQLRGKKHEHVILRDSNIFGFRLAGTVCAKNKLYYSYDVSSRNVMETKMVKKYFTDVKSFDDDTFIPNVWKAIVHRIGINDYKTKLCSIVVPNEIEEKEKDFLPKDKYILFCPEASNRQRTIDIDKCKEILQYLKNNYNCLIVVSTDCRNEIYTQELKKLVKELEVEDYMGKTTLDRFILLVSKAELLVGCDTGSIHLAAGLGVSSVCLKGYWDKPHFLPYVFDISNNEKAIPITLYPRQIPECAFCGDNKCFAEQPECRKRINSGLSLKCTYDIDNQDVYDAVCKLYRGRKYDR